MILAAIIIVALLITIIAYWRPPLALAISILLWPAYLWRVDLLNIPTTMLEMVVYGLLLGTVIGLITKRLTWQWPRVPAIAWWLVTIWIIAWAIATLMSPATNTALGALKGWCFDPLLFSAMLWFHVRTANDKKIIIRAAVLSAAIVAVAGLYQIIFAYPTLSDGRLSSFFHPVANFAAMFMAPLLVFGLALVANRSLPRLWRWLLAPIAIALLATLSYGGYLAVAIGAIVIWLFMPSSKLKKNLAISGVVVAVVFTTLLSTTANFREHFASGRSSGLVRTQIWSTSWALITQHPVVGIGPNYFEPAYRAEVPKHFWPPLEWLVAQPHNLYLALWLETGLLGLLVFLTSLIFWFRAVIKQTKRLAARPLAIAALAAMTAILAHGLVDTPYFKNDLAMMFWLILIIPGLLPDVDITNPLRPASK